MCRRRLKSEREIAEGAIGFIGFAAWIIFTPLGLLALLFGSMGADGLAGGVILFALVLAIPLGMLADKEQKKIDKYKKV